MRTITLFEHQEIAYHEWGWHAAHPALELLEKLNEAHGRELVHVGRKSLRAQQFVGVLRVGDVTLQILPKIDYQGSPDALTGTPGHAQAVESASRNLLFLLSYAYGIPLYARHQASLDSSRSAEWFELLTGLFANDLHLQMRMGLEQAYVLMEEKSPALRGTWRIDQHILSMKHERHLFDVRYDEFLPNTPLNRVFNFVAGHLLRMTQDPLNRRLLSDIDRWLLDCERPPEVPSALLDSVRFTRLNERYRTAFNLARLFVEHLSLQLSGGSRLLFAFVFDMNVLFERFVANFLSRHLREMLPAGDAGLRLSAQSSGESVYLAERVEDGVRAFKLRPDIALLPSPVAGTAAPRLLIDTKYKRLSRDHQRYGVGEDDFYQMLAYATRYDCRRILLLYPESAQSGAIHSAFAVHEKPDTRYFVHTLNLRQPLNHAAPLVEAFRDLLRFVL